MENFKEFCFKASRALAITIIIIFILLAIRRILLYSLERNIDNIDPEVAELIINEIKEEKFVKEFKSYIIELEKDWKLHYDDEVLREYIGKKLYIIKYKHNCQFYRNILLAIEDLEKLEYEYKEKLSDSDEANKIFKYEFKYKLKEFK